MPNFLGQLKPNEIFAPIFNMIISQQVFADNISGVYGDLASKSRVDGGLYGDTKLYYSTDALKSQEWLNDREAQNLLMLHRPKAPKCQAVTIDVFRMIPLTVDNYLTKRAWSTENAFSDFNSVMLGWIRETKKIYDATLFNAFVGTNYSKVASSKQNISIALPSEPDGTSEVNTEAYNRLKAQTIATAMANLLTNLKDVTRDYNDYGYIRSYSEEDLVFVWNSEWVNEITKLDIPTIFNKEGLVDKFAQNVLPARYFGNINVDGGTTSASNITVRSLYEASYEAPSDPRADEDGMVHLFAGDLLPGNVAYEGNTTYGEDPSVIFKVYHKRSIPFMSAFETGTSFFNPRSLTETHYLIWGHNPLEHLQNYPFITVKATQE